MFGFTILRTSKYNDLLGRLAQTAIDNHKLKESNECLKNALESVLFEDEVPENEIAFIPDDTAEE